MKLPGKEASADQKRAYREYVAPRMSRMSYLDGLISSGRFDPKLREEFARLNAEIEAYRVSHHILLTSSGLRSL